MVVYDYLNTETNEIEEVWLKKSTDRVDYELKHPHMKYVVNAPLIADPLRLGTYTNKLPTDFREGILGKAKSAHSLGTLQT